MTNRKRAAIGGGASIQISGTGVTRTIALSGATGGTWTYTLAGPGEDGIPHVVAWNASLVTVKNGMNNFLALSVLDAVTGTPGASYVLTFSQDPNLITVNGAGLT